MLRSCLKRWPKGGGCSPSLYVLTMRFYRESSALQFTLGDIKTQYERVVESVFLTAAREFTADDADDTDGRKSNPLNLRYLRHLRLIMVRAGTMSDERGQARLPDLRMPASCLPYLKT